MNSNRKTRRLKRIISVIVVAGVAAVAAPFVPLFLTDVLAQTATGTTDAEVDTTPASSAERPVTVEVTRVIQRSVNQSRTVAGRVEPDRTVDFAFQIPGQIVRLAVGPGDTVRAGDVIAELDRVDFELAVDRAQAFFDLANSELDRAAGLAERGVAADARLETARAQFAQADVALREARRRLSQTQIVAPFDAIVARTFVEEYVNITSAAPVARLQDLSEMLVVISLPEELAAIARATPGAFHIVASFPAVAGYTAPLVLRSFATDADQTAQTYDLKFAITGDIDPRLLPGMTADVRISISAEENRPQAVIVPVSAVDTTSRPDPSIWIYDESSGQVSRKAVQLGLPVDDEVVILDGLEGNELVVSGGWWRLSDNQAVVVSDF
ncbi:MAG: efflux RND transporter periplasmic adaptor subunit [Roseovarius sp.]|nr:efflux RND transporter periplasmic adaptor subunit [Roseovarius sp.]